MQFILSLLDLDLILLVEKLVNLTYENIIEQVNEMNTWEIFNRLSLMFIRMTIVNNIKTLLPPTTSAQKFFRATKDIFKSIDKSLAITLKKLAGLSIMILEGFKAIKIKALRINMDKSFLI